MRPAAPPTDAEAIAATCSWIDRIVIGLNLCPFAKAVVVKQQVRYVVSAARTPDALLGDLEGELRHLDQEPSKAVETTVLIHPQVLTEFLEYNDFLNVADDAIERLGLTGVLQIASFHPDYRFEGTTADDVTNYTNRSPYPMLHILREASVEAAVASYRGADEIPARNIDTLRRLGLRRLMDEFPG